MACVRITLSLLLLVPTIGALKHSQIISTSTKTENNFAQSQKLLQLITQIYKEKAFETLLIYKSNERSCLNKIDYLLKMRAATTIPRVLLTGNEKFRLKYQYNKQFLTVCCLEADTYKYALENLAYSLRRMRFSRILFVVQYKAEKGMDILSSLFRACESLQMLNVLAIFEDFHHSNDLYSFRKFPHFQVEKRSIRTEEKMFPNRLQNLYGFRLQTMLAHNAPGSILYYNKYGHPQRIGYLVKLVETFAERLNATLIYKQSLHLSKSIEPVLLAHLTYSYKIDLPILLATPAANKSLKAFSEIVEITRWMPMLPMAKKVPVSIIILRIVNSYSYFLLLHLWLFFCYSLLHTVISNYLPGCQQRLVNIRWLDILLNDRILRGLLGYSFTEIPTARYQLRLIYLLVFVHGLVLNTMFNAHVHTFIAHPPMLPQLKSFADLKSSGTKVLITNSELQLLSELSSKGFMQRYEDIFEPVRSQVEFQSRCQSLDQSYAYAMRTSGWRVFDTQQRFFGRRLFRISNKVFFRDSMLLAIPLATNSIYRESFNRYLLEVKAAGLWQHWTQRAFYDMVSAGQLNFSDVSEKHTFRAMRVRDFFWFLVAFAAALIVSLIVLLCEQIWRKFVQKHER